MIVTNTDKTVIRFLEDYKIATTNTISDLFYPCLRMAQHRLKLLTDNKHIKRDRDNYTSQYYYYLNKPRQLRHSLLVTDFYREISKVSRVEMYKAEFVIEDIRADAFVAFEYKGKKDMAFLEVELSNKGFDIDKYERLYKSGKLKKYNFPKFPIIFAVTNKNIPNSNLKIIQINEDMSDFDVDKII